MPAHARETERGAPLRPLFKQEIDRRIERVLHDVASPCATETERAGGADDPLRPRWIDASLLIRRMSGFLVYN